MLSKEVEAVVQSAMACAFAQRHEFATIEHLALALLDDPSIEDILSAFEIDCAQLKLKFQLYLDAEVDKALPAQQLRTIPSPGFHRILQNAAVHVYGAGNDEVSTAFVLAELLNEKDSHAVVFFEQEGISRLDITTFMSHASDEDFEELHDDDERANSFDEATSSSNAGEQSVLAVLTEDLGLRAKNGELDHFVGREKEIERLTHILLRRRKNNPLLVGEAGVGKTAIVEGFAQQVARGVVPDVLKDVQIFSLDVGALIAGTRYRGDFENRMKGLIKALMAKPGAILVIDEIHTIVGAGSTGGGSIDVSNLLKPLLNSGKIRCIGLTTYKEFRSHFEKDRALARRFQKIDVLEPSESDCRTIIRGIKKDYEDYHQVTINDLAVDRAIQLSSRYLSDRFLPDKAIDVIDEASAGLKLGLGGTSSPQVVTEKVIEETVARIAQIPAQQVSRNDRAALGKLEAKLKEFVFGQDRAIEEMATVIKLSRAGLGDAEKPIGSFLFTGPTGVGKTEVARQLAKVLGISFIRFDMSEYMERHTVSRLVGAPPGYVGYDQGGLLTDAAHKTPHAVLLLDEIEKAHPDVFNMLLQVMDYGKLTDTNGRSADFRHIILIMTSNIGARELSQRRIGFGDSNNTGGDEASYIRTFSPEFRNRLNGRIRFNPLSAAAMGEIVEKFLSQLQAQVSEKNIELKITPTAKEYLSVKGYDILMGARPLARLIQEQIKKPLADMMLFGGLINGGKALIDALKTGGQHSISITVQTNQVKKVRSKRVKVSS